MIATSSPNTLGSQWAEALAGADPAAVELADRLLNKLESRADAVFETAELGCGAWRVGVCLEDRIGSLSLVSGALAAHGLNIVNADTFTYVEPNSPPKRTAPPLRLRPSRLGRRVRRRRRHALDPSPAARAVMLFDVRARSGRQPRWDALADELRSLARQAAGGGIANARRRLIERFADEMYHSGAWESAPQEPPMEIRADAVSSDAYTLVEIHSVDTPGFLSAFSNALASVGANVVRAKIRTEGDRVRDAFWLTDAAGGKITDEGRLRRMRTAARVVQLFTRKLPAAPDPELALRQFDMFMSQLLSREDWAAQIDKLDSPGALDTLVELLGASRFLWEEFLRMRHDSLFPMLLDLPALDRPRTREWLAAEMERAVAPRDSLERRVRALNDVKDRELFRVGLRYITHRARPRPFRRELSALADVVVGAAFELALEEATARLGAPRLADGAPCGWGVFGLGKLGGSEMGFGSDIELMFVYEGEGMTDAADGGRPARTSTLFEEAVKGFLRALETRRHGIFEIDLRLRPYGSKGALATTLSAFEGYYGGDGDARPFERLALVRLRHIAGDARLARRVERARDAFVYSARPLDVDNIRHLRRRQAAELVGRGEINAKLSAGGLADVEYYVQARQILCGRSDARVRLTNTLDAVDALRERGCLDAELAGRIVAEYGFLRKLVDALRMVRGNANDLAIPPPSARDFHHLAHRLAVEPPEELGERIAMAMESAENLWIERPPA